MPELPEVETVKNGLAPALEGQEIERVMCHRPNLRFPLPPDLLQGEYNGRRVKQLSRRGKYMIWEFEGQAPLIVHLGMSGSFRIAGEEEVRKHDHVCLYMRDGRIVSYNDPRRFGFFEQAPLQWGEYPAFQAMGPEPLSNDFNGPALANALKGRHTPIKTALLDQGIVAGVGNIYACEALYRARISPKRKASSVQGIRAERLATAIQEVLREAIAAGGSSLKDHRRTDGEMGYFQHHFAVYDQEGAACGLCQDGTVQKMIQSGRSTFFCPHHQR